MYDFLVFDTETSGANRNKGNPFDPRNKMMALGYLSGNFDGNLTEPTIAPIEYGDLPYGNTLATFQSAIVKAKRIVGFNLKFDLNWASRYKVGFENVRVWDCQLYHFIKVNQMLRYPSLNDVLEYYGLPKKIDKVKAEYWDMGLDTDEVPWDLLSEYLTHDITSTTQVFLRQWEEFCALSQVRRNLILTHMADLVVLQAMEASGFLYDVKKSIQMGKDIEARIKEIDDGLSVYIAGSPKPQISFNSDRQLSAFLYGGKVIKDEQEEFTFHYKDGRTAQKLRWVKKEYQLPRIITPLKGTENANGWSVDVDTMRSLALKAKGFQKQILKVLIERSKLEKRKSTYCEGTPNLMESMQWQESKLHPVLNQCVAVTGRLSCAKPNLQNQDGEMRVCFKSRFSRL